MTEEYRDIVPRLRERKAFGMNGSRWMMLPQPDTDCMEAADRIEELRAAIRAMAFIILQSPATPESIPEQTASKT